MSKLYVKIDTDAIKTSFTARAHQWITGRITWDNDARKIALSFEVKWDGKEKEPLVFVNGKRIKVAVK